MYSELTLPNNQETDKTHLLRQNRFLCGRNAFRNDVEQRAGAGYYFGKLVHEKYNLSAGTTIYRMDCSNTTTNL